MSVDIGARAPAFEVIDLDGSSVSLADYQDRYLLLSFYRYAACPFCNLRIREVARAHEALSEAGVDVLAVFHSPPARLRQFMSDQTFPFRLIADPRRELYRLWGVEESWLGFAKGMLRVPTLVRAMARGHLPGKPEVSMATMPADFVVGPDGRVRTTYRGRDMGDHIPLDWVLEEAGRGR